MDLTILLNEYNSFWSNHNLVNAILELNQIRAYLSLGGKDPFSSTSDLILRPEYLMINYSFDRGDLSALTDTIHYTDLLQYLRDKIQGQINNMMGLDSATKTDLQNAKNTFDSLTGLDLISSIGIIPILLIGGVFYFISS